MTTTTTAVELAKKIGREHRDAFKDEFGDYPVRGDADLGDWDGVSWGEAHIAIGHEFDLDDSTEEGDTLIKECQEAYFDALFDDAHEPEDGPATQAESRYSVELRRSSNGGPRETIESRPADTIEQAERIICDWKGSTSDPYWGTGEHILRIYDREAGQYVD